MTDNQLSTRIKSYSEWKANLLETIIRFQKWLDKKGLEKSEDTLRFMEAIDALKNDRINLAFVAEFSRGKTELINSLFFADYNRRLLPSDAGRTTMCPTELYYDQQKETSFISLLPIETRLDDELSISEYKLDSNYWTNIPLDIDSPDQMEESMREIIKTKTVNIEEAKKLGLYFENQADQNRALNSSMDDLIEVPKWRHALISFPHPLLKQGLVILDTPGLNALGCEPELTLNMLPAAHAILFVLAADTGVTRSDLDVWQYHIEGFRRNKQKKGVAVVLNKIDTLWDDIKKDSDIDKTLESQLQKTSLMLGVEPSSIFTVSAQKALLAKIRNDEELLNKSQIASLENYLCNEILPSREQILSENVSNEIGQMLEVVRSQVIAKLENTTKQLQELRNLSGKNANMIVHLMKKTREEQTAYSKNVESFQSSRLLLKRQAGKMLKSLSLETLDKLTNTTRADMSGCWTTVGLKRGMQTFFNGAVEIMNQVVENAEQARRLVKAIYNKFHSEHGLAAIEPKAFSMDLYNRRMESLFEEAEAFRKSPVTTMTEQSFVVKKFFISLVSQARNVFYKANQYTEAWLREVMNPLVRQIKEHKTMMENRLNTLRKISDSRDTLDAKIAELEVEENDLNSQKDNLEDMRLSLQNGNPNQNQSSAA